MTELRAGSALWARECPSASPLAAATGRYDKRGAAVQNMNIMLGLEETTGLAL